MTNEQPVLVIRIVKGILKWLFILLCTLLLIGAATGAILAWYGVNYVQEVIMPQAEEATTALDLVRSDTAQTSAIYYYDAATGSYQTEQVLHSGENRVWVSYSDIPENLVNRLLRIQLFVYRIGITFVSEGKLILKIKKSVVDRCR